MTSPLPMTPGRWLALAIGIPLALLAIGYTALTAVAFAGLGSYRVNLATPVAGRAAAVNVNTGDLTVGPGPRRPAAGARDAPLFAGPSPAQLAALRVHDHHPLGLPVPAGLCLLDYRVTVPAGSRPSPTDPVT